MGTMEEELRKSILEYNRRFAVAQPFQPVPSRGIPQPGFAAGPPVVGADFPVAGENFPAAGAGRMAPGSGFLVPGKGIPSAGADFPKGIPQLEPRYPQGLPGYAVGGQFQPKGIIPGPPSRIDNTMTPTATGEYILPTNAVDQPADGLMSLMSHVMKYDKPQTAKDLLDRVSMMSTGVPPNNMGKPAEDNSQPVAKGLQPGATVGFAAGGERYPEDQSGVKFPMPERVQKYPMPERPAAQPKGIPQFTPSTNAYEMSGAGGPAPGAGAPLRPAAPKAKSATMPAPKGISSFGLQNILNEGQFAIDAPLPTSLTEPATTGIFAGAKGIPSPEAVKSAEPQPFDAKGLTLTGKPGDFRYGYDGTNGGFGAYADGSGMIVLPQRTAEQDAAYTKNEAWLAQNPQNQGIYPAKGIPQPGTPGYAGSQAEWERNQELDQLLNRPHGLGVAKLAETARNNTLTAGISQQNADALTGHYGTLDRAATAKLPGEILAQQSGLLNDEATRGNLAAATDETRVKTKLAPGIAQSKIELDMAKGEAALAKAETAALLAGYGNRGKLKQGERYAADGETIEAVPGSDLYIKQSGLHSKDKTALNTVNTQSAVFTGKIDKLLNSKAFDSLFGGYNAYASRLRPGETQNALSELAGIKANLKKMGLDIMRSGGSIGQMTEREWPIVEQAISNLDPKMSEDAARAELENIKTYLARLKDSANTVYADEWGQTQYAKAKGIPRDVVPRPQAAAPVQGAKQAPDGKWYVSDPNRPGKYLQVEA